MDIFTVLLWGITLVLLCMSLKKDFKKTIRALHMATNMGRNMLLSLLTVIFLIGMLLAIIPPETIAESIQTQNPLIATLIASMLGTLTLIPAFIAFPLMGTLLKAGVPITASVAFLTTLTMVGIVTFPLEKKTFGLKFTLLRNGLSFLFANLIALAMGGLL